MLISFPKENVIWSWIHFYANNFGTENDFKNIWRGVIGSLLIDIFPAMPTMLALDIKRIQEAVLAAVSINGLISASMIALHH